MKKIPTLFKRVYENHKVVDILPEVTPGMEWVLKGEGIATTKFDGSCCAIINDTFYKRFDAKPGRTIPEGAIPCCEPDPITGHWPHWVKLDRNNPADRWFSEAFKNFLDQRALDEGYRPDQDPDWESGKFDGTYEAIGPHFQGNPYYLSIDIVVRHGNQQIMQLEDNHRTFEYIKSFLESNKIEGIVFWKDGEPQCKIKRTDFGFDWPVKVKKED